MGEALIWGLFVFIVVFLINFLWIFKRGYENIKKQKSKKKNKKLEEFVGLSYLIPKFKLDINKMDLNYVFFMVSLIDAFVFVVITIIPWDMGFSMLLGFVLLFGLIYALYEILGRVLVKKGWSKNES